MAGPVAGTPYTKGDVVVLAFPFSDLTTRKRRPALVVAISSPGDVILCAITTRGARNHAVRLSLTDFRQGGLNQESYVRTNVLVTFEVSQLLYKAGSIKKDKMADITAAIVQFLTA